MTYAASNNSTIMWQPMGMSVTTEKTDRPSAAPPGLIATRAIEVEAGWLGQVAVDGTIVWQSKPLKTAQRAMRAANGRVVLRLKALLSDVP
jgi:hypothetical protein